MYCQIWNCNARKKEKKNKETKSYLHSTIDKNTEGESCIKKNVTHMQHIKINHQTIDTCFFALNMSKNWNILHSKKPTTIWEFMFDKFQSSKSGCQISDQCRIKS